MALTITVAQLASAMRVGTTSTEVEQVTRLLVYAEVAISQHLGSTYATTPDAAVNEAAIRIASYLYDQPTASSGLAFGNAMRFSGAARILLPYRLHKAGSTAEAVAAVNDAVGSAGGLRLIGSETLTVATTYEWIATALPAPQTDTAGVSVIAPDGSETGIQLFRAAQLTGSAVAGSDATADLERMFALETAADGTVLFASKEAGAHTIFLYEASS